MTKEQWMTTLGWVGTATAILMYISYIPQISNNLSGHKGDFLQPFVAFINCTLWVAYGLFKSKRADWPIVIANAPGIFFGLAASLTAL